MEGVTEVLLYIQIIVKKLKEKKNYKIIEMDVLVSNIIYN